MNATRKVTWFTNQEQLPSDDSMNECNSMNAAKEVTRKSRRCYT